MTDEASQYPPGSLFDGKYRIRRCLGTGGMGYVLEAVHQRLQQQVALKVLRPELSAEPEFLVRFEREARATARLRSPHVVKVFDVDTTRDGITYIVMELLSGLDLATELETGSIPIGTLIDWMIQCCDALEEARAHGIVHRDLKPANIFLADDATLGRVAKVLDFGISKFLNDEGTPATRTKLALGTPQYMSPEQVRALKTIDHRSDIWSLGVILYRAISNRSPFDAASDTDLLVAIATDPPIPLERVRPDIPFELASVVMRALEKSPSDRYQSAREFADAMRTFGTGVRPIPPAPSLLPFSTPLRAAPRGSISTASAGRASNPGISTASAGRASSPDISTASADRASSPGIVGGTGKSRPQASASSRMQPTAAVLARVSSTDPPGSARDEARVSLRVSSEARAFEETQLAGIGSGALEALSESPPQSAGTPPSNAPTRPEVQAGGDDAEGTVPPNSSGATVQLSELPLAVQQVAAEAQSNSSPELTSVRPPAPPVAARASMRPFSPPPRAVSELPPRAEPRVSEVTTKPVSALPPRMARGANLARKPTRRRLSAVWLVLAAVAALAAGYLLSSRTSSPDAGDKGGIAPPREQPPIAPGTAASRGASSSAPN